MPELQRITFDVNVMGGKPCIRGMRVTVGTIVGLLASGHSKEEILKLYPYLEIEDIDEALSFSAKTNQHKEICNLCGKLNWDGDFKEIHFEQ